MNYYHEIKKKLIDNEIYSRVKDYSKEKHRVITYLETGKLLHEAGSVYGEDIIGQYANKLQVEVGKKYNKRTLFRMRQFYISFSDAKVSPMATQLNWSHYTELLPIKDKDKMMYYLNITINNNLTKRELRNKIRDNEYERLPEQTKYKLILNEETSVNEK